MLEPGVDPPARVDDADTGRTLRFEGCAGVYRADDLHDVAGAIEWASGESRAGRWVVGFVAYEAAPAFDSALPVIRPQMGPLAWFASYRSADGPPWEDVGSHHTSRWSPAVDRDSYGTAFDRAHDAIRRGDTYQVNLTFPMRASFAGDPRSLYRDLLQSQDVPYAAYLDAGDLQVVSVSPERFFSITDRRITTRPMKGTRPRGRWMAEDHALVAALEASDKDRAENLMIVDLIRNDIGRIARTGTVEPGALFTVEAYRTVWQMTSEVSAELDDDVDLLGVFAALFPCGSVTGAPKTSTMRLIADLEPGPRGVYCGAVGFIPPGDGIDGASFNVAIRTAVVDPVEGVVTYGVGGGVTWDSAAYDEYSEALAKAATLAAGRPVEGIFETIRWDGAWTYLDDHLDRLAWSGAVHGIPIDRSRVTARLDELVGGLVGPSRVRVAVGSDGSMAVRVGEAPPRFARGPGPSSNVVSLAIDHDPVDPADRTLYVKTTDRTRYERRRRRHPDADDVLLTNTSGAITESSIANVAVRIGGVWYTPPVSDGLLPGILRGRLVSDGVLEERSISAREAMGADGLALLNSVRGWQPATLAAVTSARRAGSR